MSNILSSAKRVRRVVWLLVVLALILLLLPQFLSGYMLFLITEILIYSIFALSLNMLMGYTGLPSLGHAVFFGMGGYTVALLITKLGFQSFWLLLGVALVTTVILGFVMGVLVIRSSGVYFIMITVAIGQILWAIAWSWRSLTGGSDGIGNIGRPDIGLPISLMPATNFYYFVLIFFAICVFLMYLIIISPYGRALVGIRENEVRMKALGYATWRYKYFCLLLAGMFAGFAGVLKVYQDGYVQPGFFNVAMSGLLFVMVITGGQRLFIGPIVGTAIILLVRHLVSSYTEHWAAVLGVILIAVLLFAPQGVAGYIAQKLEVRKHARLRG